MAKPRRKDNGAPQNGGDMTATIDRDRLAQRAYELYLARGGEDGRDLEDWLTAERELLERETLQTQGQ
jgi:outer membrane protein TolC